MSNGRYGTPSPGEKKTDVELAEIRAELRNQGRSIATVSTKMDTVAEAVTKMTIQMEHLVTKESCAMGMAALGEDLKNRMDGSRDITGHNVSISDLLKEYVKKTKSDTPKQGVEPVQKKHDGKSERTSWYPKRRPKGAAFWISLASGILALAVTFYSASVFINKTIERQEQTQGVLIQIQKTLAKQSGHGESHEPSKTREANH